MANKFRHRHVDLNTSEEILSLYLKILVSELYTDTLLRNCWLPYMGTGYEIFHPRYEGICYIKRCQLSLYINQ